MNCPQAERPPLNLVFLIDVSGSMSAADKLPLAQKAMNP
jgi:Ca-activated chloride channel family protein